MIEKVLPLSGYVCYFCELPSIVPTNTCHLLSPCIPLLLLSAELLCLSFVPLALGYSLFCFWCCQFLRLIFFFTVVGWGIFFSGTDCFLLWLLHSSSFWGLVNFIEVLRINYWCHHEIGSVEKKSKIS